MFFYRTKPGEVLGAAHSNRQGADWIERYKEALGLTEDVEEFEAEEDPRPANARTEPLPIQAPDVGGFKLALYAETAQGGLGKAKARAIARDYPDTVDALNAGRFDIFRMILEELKTGAVITQDEYDAVCALMTTFNIPDSTGG